MAVMGSDSEIENVKLRCSLQYYIKEERHKTFNSNEGTENHSKYAQNHLVCEQGKSNAPVACKKLPPETRFEDENSFEHNAAQPLASERENGTVLSKTTVQAVRRRETQSSIPTLGGMKLAATESKHSKIELEKRKALDDPTSDSSYLKSSPGPTNQPTSRFPRVSSRSLSHPLRSRPSAVGSTGSGVQERHLCLALPQIRPPGGAARGRSRIPVRDCSADCRTDQQAARMLRRSGSCDSDSGHQAARRSARSSSCGLTRDCQAVRKSTRSGSCGSFRGRQTALNLGRTSSYDSGSGHHVPRRSAGSRSCSSIGRQQRATRHFPATSSWSLIDVNNNARLLQKWQTGKVLEHEFHDRPRRDLNVIDQQLGKDARASPSLPRVQNSKHQEGRAAGWSSVVGRSAIPARSQRPAGAARSPPGPHQAALRSQRGLDPGPAPVATAPRTRRKASKGGMPQPMSGAASPSKGVPGASRCFQVSGASSRGVSPGVRPSQAASGAGQRRPSVEYQPNLTPYPRQYILLGMLGADPDMVKRRQDKMKRRQEYVERLARLNRAAARRRMLVPLRACCAGPRRPGYSSRPQLIQDGVSLQTASAGCVASSGAPVSKDEERRTSTPEKLKLSLAEECHTVEEDSRTTYSLTGLDNSGQMMDYRGRDSPDSDCHSNSESNSVSECVSESSLLWGPEEAHLVAEKLSALLAAELNTSAADTAGLMSSDGSETEAQRRDIMTWEATEAETELKRLPFEPELKETEQAMSKCDVNLSEVAASQPISQSPTPKAEAKTPSAVAETETAVPTYTGLRAVSPDLRDAWTEENLATKTGEIETNWDRSRSVERVLEESATRSEETKPDWFKPGSVEGVPVWANKCTRLVEQVLSAAEESEGTWLLSIPKPTSEPAESPATLPGHGDSTAAPLHKSEAESDSRPNSYSGSGSDSISDSESEAEMMDAQEELPQLTLHPDSSPPALVTVGCADGDRDERRPTRRCSSEDLFLELPEQMSVRVTAGPCSAAADGCSCGTLVTSVPSLVSRATQSPGQQASFVYKNLLVMNIGSHGTASQTTPAGLEWWKAREEVREVGTAPEPGLGLEAVPGPGQGQGRRRRWDSSFCPTPLQLVDDPAAWDKVDSRWSDEDLQQVRRPLGYEQEGHCLPASLKWLPDDL